MRRAGLLIGLLLIAAPAKAAPERIVSLNLCADQMLLALADRGQIAALSHLATDPGISAAAEAARVRGPQDGPWLVIGADTMIPASR